MKTEFGPARKIAVWKGLLVIASAALVFSVLMPRLSRGAEDPERKYRKSKLTNDKSEMTADRRKILLTKGEDKVIDLDFDANFSKDGIMVGDPTKVVPH